MRRKEFITLLKKKDVGLEKQCQISSEVVLTMIFKEVDHEDVLIVLSFIAYVCEFLY